MKNTALFLLLFFFVFFGCSSAKKTEQTDETKTNLLKHDMYWSIQRIAEVLPMKTKEAIDFFDGLDSIVARTPRYGSSQQLQYKYFTVFYELPSKGIVRSVGIDLDTTSHISMEKLGTQLGTIWHSPDLIEVEAGKSHYSADFIDSKKVKKKIHITIGLSNRASEKDSEVTFINVEAEVPILPTREKSN